MIEDSTSAAQRPSSTTALYAVVDVKINVRVTYEIILSIGSTARQGLSETELTRARSGKHEVRDYHNSTGPMKCSAVENVENQLALAVAKRGLCAIVGVIILKVMKLCEGIAGTVDFAQIVGQGLANLLKLF
jgi:hypothetical protein